MTTAVVVKYRDTHETTWTTNLDLSTASLVRLLAKDIKTKVVTPLATTAGGDDFSVKHKLTGTLPVGDYDVELEATYAAGIITSPSNGYVRLRVIQDIA
jgi:hypothetical protein